LPTSASLLCLRIHTSLRILPSPLVAAAVIIGTYQIQKILKPSSLTGRNQRLVLRSRAVIRVSFPAPGSKYLSATSILVLVRDLPALASTLLLLPVPRCYIQRAAP
jgi:hypothetical protein